MWGLCSHSHFTWRMCCASSPFSLPLVLPVRIVRKVHTLTAATWESASQRSRHVRNAAILQQRGGNQTSPMTARFLPLFAYEQAVHKAMPMHASSG